MFKGIIALVFFTLTLAGAHAQLDAAAIASGPSLTGKPRVSAGGPRVSAPSGAHPANPFTRYRYPWKKNITATIFWIGEKPTARNPTPNCASSWDTKWAINYGGYDDPNPAARINYRPKAFTPKLNPFYIALPYNDRINWKEHKPEASKVIPWFKAMNPKPGKTVLKGRWLQIVHNNRVCYAQWEDCGPFLTDDWRYVFGNSQPANPHNSQAGIDISPAVRDYLKVRSGDKVHWRFIHFKDVPHGPWALYGTNNPFIHPEQDPDLRAQQRYMRYLREVRDGKR